MKFYLRPSVLMLSIGAFVGAPFSSGAAAARTQAQVRVLDHADFLCANCFFGPSDYYFCFATDDNKILIAYQRTPVLNWRDKSKNYLTRVRHSWTVWTAPSQPFPISYDDKNIWVSRENGKEVKLIRSSLRDIFNSDNRCRGPEAVAGH